MKRTLSLLAIPSVFILAACGSKDGTNSETPGTKPAALSAENASPHFEEVLSHLDVGGKVLHFEDQSDRRETYLGLFNILKKAVPEAGLDQYDLEGLLDESGLVDSAAYGRSLAKDGDMWVMRNYISYPNGPAPYLSVLGQSTDFKTATTLPAETDLALETNLNTTEMPGYLMKLAKVAGYEEELKSVMGEMLPIGMSTESLLGKIDLHLLAGVEIGQADGPIPSMPTAWYLEINGSTELMDKVKSLMVQAMDEPQADGDKQIWTLPVPAVPGSDEPTGVIIIKGGDTLIAASSKEYLAEVEGDSDKLSGNSDFQEVTNHFPKAGNMMVYLSPDFPVAAVSWATMAAESEGEDEVADIINKIPDYLVKKAWSTCIVCEDKGMTTISEMPYALDASLTSAATMLGATSTLFIGARSWNTGSERAGCIMNIRNAQMAIRSYANMYDVKPYSTEDSPGGTIPAGEIVGAGKFLETSPVCPGGGTYNSDLKGAIVIPKIGEAYLKCSLCDSEGHEPDDTTGW